MGHERRASAVVLTPPDRPLHGQPAPYDRLHLPLYLAEAAGTALLVSVGLSLVIVFFGRGSALSEWLPSNALRRVLTGACFGTVGALIAISPLGRISGAHINPSVSVAFWLEGKLAWRDLLGYVLAQMVGAILGAIPLLLWGSMGRSVNYAITRVGAGVPLWMAFGGEVIATLALVLSIFIVGSHVQTRRFTPWTIPPLFAWLNYWEAPLSGASTNAARSVGPAVIAGVWTDLWIYLTAPLLGASLAVLVLRVNLLGQHRVEVARVARHDH